MKQEYLVPYESFFEDEDITKNPNFKRWFGHSKVVDKSGKPLVVYHGTNSSFSAFKGVTYFAVDESEAKAYAKHRHEGGTSKVVGVYLSIQNPADENDLLGVARSLKVYDEGQSIAELADNPKVVNTLKAKGFDGIMGLWDYGFISDFNQIEVIVAFYPNQIKSATDNNGEFNKNSHNIYESQDDIAIGDIIRTGKFKNKRATVTGFGTDKNNQPTVITDKGEMSLYHVRIGKLMKEDANKSEYLKWKKKNVTYRGMKSVGKDNEVFGSFGKGLYTTPLSNKAMAKTYGDLYFVVGAIPKKPKLTYSLNDAEIWRQTLVADFCKKHNVSYSLQFFERHTSVDKEALKLGFDGLIIKGREMVNYEPKDIKYFRNESDLIEYYEQSSLKEEVLRLDEDIKISDLMKASMSSFTRKFNKETNKLMGNPTNHTKLIQAKANKSKDYIDFFWVTERTPKYKDNFHVKVVNPKNWSLHKDNLYTIQLRLKGFFTILDLKSNPNPTDADIESAFWLSQALIWDDTPMFHFQGANFNLSLLSGSLHPTDIPPKHWNKYHNSDQFLSKHSAGVFQSIKFYIPQMRQIVKKYLTKKKTNK